MTRSGRISALADRHRARLRARGLERDGYRLDIRASAGRRPRGDPYESRVDGCLRAEESPLLRPARRGAPAAVRHARRRPALPRQGRLLDDPQYAFTALDWLRVESYLLFYPYDNSETYPFADEAPGDTVWELGLDFTVTNGKTGFRGAEEHARLRGRERFKIFGVLLDGLPAAVHGTPLTVEGSVETAATAHTLPFDDPAKTKRIAVG